MFELPAETGWFDVLAWVDNQLARHLEKNGDEDLLGAVQNLADFVEKKLLLVEASCTSTGTQLEEAGCGLRDSQYLLRPYEEIIQGCSDKLEKVLNICSDTRDHAMVAELAKADTTARKFADAARILRNVRDWECSVRDLEAAIQSLTPILKWTAISPTPSANNYIETIQKISMSIDSLREALSVVEGIPGMGSRKPTLDRLSARLKPILFRALAVTVAIEVQRLDQENRVPEGDDVPPWSTSCPVLLTAFDSIYGSHDHTAPAVFGAIVCRTIAVLVIQPRWLYYTTRTLSTTCGTLFAGEGWSAEIIRLHLDRSMTKLWDTASENLPPVQSVLSDFVEDVNARITKITPVLDLVARVTADICKHGADGSCDAYTTSIALAVSLLRRIQTLIVICIVDHVANTILPGSISIEAKLEACLGLYCELVDAIPRQLDNLMEVHNKVPTGTSKFLDYFLPARSREFDQIDSESEIMNWTPNNEAIIPATGLLGVLIHLSLSLARLRLSSTLSISAAKTKAALEDSSTMNPLLNCAAELRTQLIAFTDKIEPALYFSNNPKHKTVWETRVMPSLAGCMFSSALQMSKAFLYIVRFDILELFKDRVCELVLSVAEHSSLIEGCLHMLGIFVYCGKHQLSSALSRVAALPGHDFSTMKKIELIALPPDSIMRRSVWDKLTTVVECPQSKGDSVNLEGLSYLTEDFEGLYISARRLSVHIATAHLRNHLNEYSGYLKHIRDQMDEQHVFTERHCSPTSSLWETLTSLANIPGGGGVFFQQTASPAVAKAIVCLMDLLGQLFSFAETGRTDMEKEAFSREIESAVLPAILILAVDLFLQQVERIQVVDVIVGWRIFADCCEINSAVGALSKHLLSDEVRGTSDVPLGQEVLNRLKQAVYSVHDLQTTLITLVVTSTPSPFQDHKAAIENMQASSTSFEVPNRDGTEYKHSYRWQIPRQ